MEHVCSKVEIIFLRLMDYTEIRNKIVLCMTLQNRLDFSNFSSRALRSVYITLICWTYDVVILYYYETFWYYEINGIIDVKTKCL